MNKRNVFAWHVILALLGVLIGAWTATDYVARAYRFHPALGSPWFVLRNHPVYAPWAWMRWDLRFGQRDPALFKTATLILAAVVIGTFAFLVALAIYRFKHESQKDGYGTSRWATEAELRDAGLLGESGIVLAQTADAQIKAIPQKDGTPKLKLRRPGRHLIRDGAASHTLVFASTRSGKGVGIVIPTLVTWMQSLIAWDIKGELWQLTAGFRRRFSHVLRFEPASPGSIRYNPLAEIRKGDEYEVRDAQAVATMILDLGEKADGDHWIETGKILMTGVILHVLYAEPDKTLHGITTFMSDPSRDAFATLERMLNTNHLGDRPHPMVAWAARTVLNKSENEMSGVFSTATARLALYLDPMVARATSTSDFRIADLMHADHPVSLYMIVPPAPPEIKRLRPLIRLMLDQILGRLTEKTVSGGAPKPKNNLLVCLDEFPTLKKMDVFESGVGFFAGFGIRCLFIAQGMQQLEQLYTRETAIPGNCLTKATFGVLDAYTAEGVSKLLGETTHEAEQLSVSGNRLGPWLGHASKSIQHHARALLTPGEVLQLPPTDAIVLCGAMHPYRAKKVIYYQDRRFSSRVGLPVPNAWEEQVKEFIPGSGNPWDALPPIAPSQPAAAAPAALVMPALAPQPRLQGSDETSAPSQGVAEVRHDGLLPGAEPSTPLETAPLALPVDPPPAPPDAASPPTPETLTADTGAATAPMDLFDSFSPSGTDSTGSGGGLPL